MTSDVEKSEETRSSHPASGFTLVEILVVGSIVAILAVGAIPLYTGFIHSQREDLAKNIARSTAAAARIFERRTGAPPICGAGHDLTCISLLNIFLPDPAQYSIDIDVTERLTRKVTVTDLEHNDIVQTAIYDR